ncbi:MAG: glycosyltransferase [Nanoarchaeota archaeon]
MVVSSTKYPFQVLYVSSFPPRECGIATFTQDLTQALDKKINPTVKSAILAINDNGSSIYNYKKDVINQMDESDMEHYIEKVKEINENENIKLVCIQHEFGLFGGEYGSYLLPFMESLTKPVVVNFHSVIQNPNIERKKVVQAIAKRCSAILVMTEIGKKILSEQYNIDQSKIKIIPHGVPNVKRADVINAKEKLGLSNRIVLSTFGLLSRGKGIEYVIRSLPKVVKKYPNLLYVIVGETHPKVRKEEGESYRLKLINIVKRLKLTENVRFYNKYLSLEEIIQYLQASDIYINASLDPDQITSGTVAYSLGAGKAIISTPSLYARDVLSKNRGILVPFRNSKSFTNAIFHLIEDPKLKKEIENNAYELGKTMIWSNVANSYFEVYKNIVDINPNVGLRKLPKIRLDHMRNLTDDTGIVQHSKYSIKNNNTGYTLDDNARALIVASRHYNLQKNNITNRLINRYLSFIHYTQMRNGKFHNFVSYKRKFLDKVGSEDSFGRALWACATVVSSNNIHNNIKLHAKEIFDKSKDIKFKTPRGQAYFILGLYQYYKKYKQKWILQKIKKYADELVSVYKHESTKDWKWFEKNITYSNGRLPQALFLAYDLTKDKKYLKIAERSLKFLTEIVIIDNKLILVGQKGWYKYNGKRAFYDQQPVDAGSMADVYLDAYRITKKPEYYNKALITFNWFLGKNSLNMTMYDETTGGCYDGLMERSINLNQGAESTLAYLMSRLNLEIFHNKN